MSAVASYRNTVDPAERRRIQAAVVEAYRGRVARLVRRLVPAGHREEEGEQVGLIGVLVALEKYDPERAEWSWFFAARHVRDEIQKWMDCGPEDDDGPDGDDGEPIPEMWRAA